MTQLYNYFKTSKSDLEVLICEDLKEAHELESVAKFFNKDVLVFPDLRASRGDDLRSYKEELHELLYKLRRYYTAEKKPLLPKKEYLQSVTLEFGSHIDLTSFKEKMLHWGYTFVDMVQVEGEISHRGDILDIFVPANNSPVRISLFDVEIEQIKTFDPDSQRTTGEELEAIEIRSAFFALDEVNYNTLNERIETSEYDALSRDIASLGFWHLEEMAENFLEGKKVKLSRHLDDLLKDAYGINNPIISRACFDLEILEENDEIKELVVADVTQL
ncbi:MAG: transcription-repair coupling factor, partial [Campylobacterales bacterium]|nr:transcription-repair coupling factor [Campylobacterales bacterium]